MVTGASTANVALILIDARLGVLQQSRRHAFIASLLGIPHLAVCVNKMDLVGYDPEVFERIKATFLEFAGGLAFKDVTFFPVSALKGINIVTMSDTYTPWYDAGSVLEYLEAVPIASDRNLVDFRFPVQTVLRPHLNYRGFAGEVAAGEVKKGDTMVSLPSGKSSRVRSIDTFEGELALAHTPMSVVLRLEDEIDVSRGDMLVKADNLPNVSRAFDAHLVWMSERPLDTDKTYLIKHTTQSARAQVETVVWKKDMDTLEEVSGDGVGLALNDIGRVRVTCHRALYFDPYVKNRTTGAFVLIDSLNNNTVAAGMIVAKEASQDLDAALREVRAGSALEPITQVSPRERRERMGQKGATVWLTGLPGSGRWTLAYALERRLFDLGRTATVVAPVGEDLRSMISAAKAATDAGLITICAFPSYHQADRERVRVRIGGSRFVQVYVNTREALCRERRPDANFEGFEPPKRPDVTVDLESIRLDAAIDAILESLERHGQFEEL
jgi:bifunctional enzyme CysN/CysC